MIAQSSSQRPTRELHVRVPTERGAVVAGREEDWEKIASKGPHIVDNLRTSAKYRTFHIFEENFKSDFEAL